MLTTFLIKLFTVIGVTNAKLFAGHIHCRINIADPLASSSHTDRIPYAPVSDQYLAGDKTKSRNSGRIPCSPLAVPACPKPGLSMNNTAIQIGSMTETLQDHVIAGYRNLPFVSHPGQKKVAFVGIPHLKEIIVFFIPAERLDPSLPRKSGGTAHQLQITVGGLLNGQHIVIFRQCIQINLKIRESLFLKAL